MPAPAERQDKALQVSAFTYSPQGNNTIAGPLRHGRERGQEVHSTTRISGLQVASCYDGHRAIPACRATGGTGHLVTDQLIWDVQKRLAREEGIFCEPAELVARIESE